MLSPRGESGSSRRRGNAAPSRCAQCRRPVGVARPLAARAAACPDSTPPRRQPQPFARVRAAGRHSARGSRRAGAGRSSPSIVHGLASTSASMPAVAPEQRQRGRRVAIAEADDAGDLRLQRAEMRGGGGDVGAAALEPAVRRRSNRRSRGGRSGTPAPRRREPLRQQRHAAMRADRGSRCRPTRSAGRSCPAAASSVPTSVSPAQAKAISLSHARSIRRCRRPAAAASAGSLPGSARRHSGARVDRAVGGLRRRSPAARCGSRPVTAGSAAGQLARSSSPATAIAGDSAAVAQLRAARSQFAHQRSRRPAATDASGWRRSASMSSSAPLADRDAMNAAGQRCRRRSERGRASRPAARPRSAPGSRRCRAGRAARRRSRASASARSIVDREARACGSLPRTAAARRRRPAASPGRSAASPRARRPVVGPARSAASLNPAPCARRRRPARRTSPASRRRPRRPRSGCRAGPRARSARRRPPSNRVRAARRTAASRSRNAAARSAADAEHVAQHGAHGRRSTSASPSGITIAPPDRLAMRGAVAARGCNCGNASALWQARWCRSIPFRTRSTTSCAGAARRGRAGRSRGRR